MKCEMCLKENAESVGLHCGKYKVCNPCIRAAIEARMFLIGRNKL